MDVVGAEMGNLRKKVPRFAPSFGFSGENEKARDDKSRAFRYLMTGRYRARTCDPLIKSQLLYQLS